MWTTDTKVFVATSLCCIEVRSLEEKACPRIHRVPTVSEVRQVVFSETGNYLATREVKMSRKAKLGFARIYLNWCIDFGKQPMKVRIAGHPNRKNVSSENRKYLEVIEIPSSKSPSYISVCDRTGNLAVAWGNVVSVYSLTDHAVTENTMCKDLTHLFNIKFVFVISEIAICMNYIAACSRNEVQVVRLCQLNLTSSEDNGPGNQPDVPLEPTDESKYILRRILKNKQESDQGPASYDTDRYTPVSNTPSSPTPSSQSCDHHLETSQDYVIDDEHCESWDFEDGEFHTVAAVGIPGPRPTPSIALSKSVRLEGLQPTKYQEFFTSIEITGPVKCGTKGPSVFVDQKDASIESVLLPETMLYRLFTTLQGYLHSLQFQMACNTCLDDVGSEVQSFNPFQCPSGSQLSGLCVFFSGSREGFLYKVLGNVELLSVYPYTIDAFKVALTPTFLHAVTKAGLETYTSRFFVSTLSSTENLDGINTACPDASLEICLIGMQPFIGLMDIQKSDDKLVLISKDKSHRSDCEWSLYSLKNCSAVEMFHDMVEMGNRNKSVSPVAYSQLIQEAHLVLRYQVSKQKNAENVDLKKVYLESCALLGDYYARTGVENGHLALPYYLMSELSLEDVVNRIMGKVKQEKGLLTMFGKGLIYYLDYMLLNRQQELKQSTSNTVLDIYGNIEPGQLALVVLNVHFHRFSDEHAISCLLNAYHKLIPVTDRHVNMLAQALLYLRIGEPEEAKEVLLSMPKDGLLNVCVDHYHLLHEHMTEFSHLAQLLRLITSTLFIDILVALYDRGLFTVDSTVKLLTAGQHPEELYKNNHVREYLEALLSSNKRHLVFPEALNLLCGLYINRLQHWSSPVSRQVAQPGHIHFPKNKGHFGVRPVWLNEIPPFKGHASIFIQPCNHLQRSTGSVLQRSPSVKASEPVQIKQGESDVLEECACCCCNEDLLKIQSLMSYKNISPDLVMVIQQKLNTNYDDFKGRSSLTLMCLMKLDVQAAIDLVIENYPRILARFATTVCDSKYDLWSHIMHSMTAILQQPDQSNVEVYTQAFKDVLTEMSKRLETVAFLNLLPKQGSVQFFLKYIQQCCEKQQARKLREKIVMKGENLQTAS